MDFAPSISYNDGRRREAGNGVPCDKKARIGSGHGVAMFLDRRSVLLRRPEVGTGQTDQHHVRALPDIAVSEAGSGNIGDLEVRQQQTQPFPPFMLRDARTKSKEWGEGPERPEDSQAGF